MSVLQSLIKVSAPITNDADLESFITEARRQRRRQSIPNFIGNSWIPGVGAAISAGAINPELNRKLEGAGLGAAGQTAGQNFLGSLGSWAGGAAMASPFAALGGVLGQGLMTGEYSPRSMDALTDLAGGVGRLGGAVALGLPAAAIGMSVIEKMRAKRLENRIRDAYAAKTSSAITNEDDLNRFVMEAKRDRSTQSYANLFGNALTPGAGSAVSALLLNPALNRKLEGAGLSAAGQSAGQNLVGGLGSGMSLVGGGAGGLGLGALLGGGLGAVLTRGRNPDLVAGLGGLGGALGGLAGSIGGYAASERNRANRLEKRIRDAYAANAG